MRMKRSAAGKSLINSTLIACVLMIGMFAWTGYTVAGPPIINSDHLNNLQTFISKVQSLNLADQSPLVSLKKKLASAQNGDQAGYMAEVLRSRDLYQKLDLSTQQKIQEVLAGLPDPHLSQAEMDQVDSSCFANCLFGSCSIEGGGSCTCYCSILGDPVCSCIAPALSTYGAIILVMLLLVTGTWMVRKKRVHPKRQFA